MLVVCNSTLTLITSCSLESRSTSAHSSLLVADGTVQAVALRTAIQTIRSFRAGYTQRNRRQWEICRMAKHVRSIAIDWIVYLDRRSCHSSQPCRCMCRWHGDRQHHFDTDTGCCSQLPTSQNILEKGQATNEKRDWSKEEFSPFSALLGLWWYTLAMCTVSANPNFRAWAITTDQAPGIGCTPWWSHTKSFAYAKWLVDHTLPTWATILVLIPNRTGALASHSVASGSV